MSIHAKKFKDDRGEYSEAVTVSLFLTKYFMAQRAMREATRLMLDIANNADPGYKPIHKRMVKLVRAWNQIEHDREKRPRDTGPTYWKKTTEIPNSEGGVRIDYFTEFEGKIRHGISIDDARIVYGATAKDDDLIHVPGRAPIPLRELSGEAVILPDGPHVRTSVGQGTPDGTYQLYDELRSSTGVTITGVGVIRDQSGNGRHLK